METKGVVLIGAMVLAVVLVIGVYAWEQRKEKKMKEEQFYEIRKHVKK